MHGVLYLVGNDLLGAAGLRFLFEFNPLLAQLIIQRTGTVPKRQLICRLGRFVPCFSCDHQLLAILAKFISIIQLCGTCLLHESDKIALTVQVCNQQGSGCVQVFGNSLDILRNLRLRRDTNLFYRTQGSCTELQTFRKDERISCDVRLVLVMHVIQLTKVIEKFPGAGNKIVYRKAQTRDIATFIRDGREARIAPGLLRNLLIARFRHMRNIKVASRTCRLSGVIWISRVFTGKFLDPNGGIPAKGAIFVIDISIGNPGSSTWNTTDVIVVEDTRSIRIRHGLGHEAKIRPIGTQVRQG